MVRSYGTRLALLVVLAVLVGGRPNPYLAKASEAGEEYTALELRPPAIDQPTEINPAGVTVLPSGRFLTPLGVQVKVPPHPYGLGLSPNGQILVTSSNGTWPFSVSVLTRLRAEHPKVVHIPRGYPQKHSLTDPRSLYMGVAIGADNRTLYVSEGDNGKIGRFDLKTRRPLGAISLDRAFRGKTYQHSLVGEIRLSPDGRTLYALDLAHFELVTIGARSGKILARTRVGRLPFGLALSPDGKSAYISNIGMFRYSVIPGYDPRHPRQTGLPFPPFGFPSPAAENGTVVDGRKIPGLGSPNVPQSNSVYVMDVANRSRPEIQARVRTGLPVGPESAGGSSPGAVVAGRESVFVSNTAQDSITIFNARTRRIEKTLGLTPAPSVRGLRGVLPFGLALSPDGTRLYVACAGINAVAVINTEAGKVIGYFPTGWFPAELAMSPDGKTLYVANTKGFGAGPNGGPNFHRGPEGVYIGDITQGTVSIIRIPPESRLPFLTHQVLVNNGFLPPPHPATRSADFPIPPPGVASTKIRHVVFIVKENRTFDEVFGDLGSVGGQPVNGIPEMARWGMDATVINPGEPVIHHARVTPNEHALARRFGISDNFYMDSDVSVDGHHWLQGSYPTELLESAWPASYGGRLRFYPDNATPGRLMMVDTSPRPEDYTEAGTIWSHFAQYHISFRNYGEGFSFAGERQGPGLEPTGERESVNTPMPEALFKNTSRHYAMFNLSIPDQYRFQQFKKDFDRRYVSGKEPLPQFIYIWLPNDHTEKPHPQNGYPYTASYVADNDLALGKMVDLLSHSRFWKHMAIFVTEDDSQGGVDHVDAHRSLLLVISPYSRQGVSHVHTDMMSILKTFDLIFGIPPLNQFDAAAAPLGDRFTDQPDFAAYTYLPSDTRVFDPAKARDPLFDLRTGRPLPPSAPLDDPNYIRGLLQGPQGSGGARPEPPTP